MKACLCAQKLLPSPFNAEALYALSKFLDELPHVRLCPISQDASTSTIDADFGVVMTRSSKSTRSLKATK
jgi:hypothetical protein